MISEEAERIIKEFLVEWWSDLSWKAQETVLGTQLPYAEPDNLYNNGLGWTLQEIAKAAEGQLERNDVTCMETLDACQQICEWMFARPAMFSAYDIPSDFWATPIGDIVLRAHIWARGDELITISRAKEISGRSLSHLSQIGVNVG